ncbi:MAG: hypothetical protein GC164_12250 [Phycisphaera sp.]|nr:hypothetical protein [Phycisphaera sp.]
MRAHTIFSGLVRVVVICAILYAVWLWGFCRFYVPPDHMAIVIARTGSPLPADRILAKTGEIGIREQVLGEGRHFLNPWLYDHEIMDLIEVPSGKVGIVTSKVGSALPVGEFLADAGQKGIQRQVLGPGKYRLNPYGYRIDMADAVSIPIGYVGVVTSLSGEKAPDGDFASGNQKGIRSDVLQPGLYYINPKQFKIDVLEIGVNQVSLLGKIGTEVITKSLGGFGGNEAIGQLTYNTLQERNVQRENYAQQQLANVEDKQQADELRNRLAQSKSRANTYWNSSEQQAVNAPATQPGYMPPQQGAAAPSFVLSQFVEFPSRDGFQISLDMTVEFELLTTDIARIYRDYGDLTLVVDNIIMPQVLSISRLKGSAYRATDFIVGEGREKFQTDITEALKTILKNKRIVIHNALIRHVEVPDQILAPIQQTSIALEQELTIKEKQNTAKKQAQLNTELSMIDQSRETVAQETSKLTAEIKADQEKQVAQINAQTLKSVATINQDIAGVLAQKVKKIGQAQADVITMVEGEKAKGFELKVSAFGDPSGYGLWEMAKGLSDKITVNIFHAGEGTLWTDLKNAGIAELGGASMLKKDK